MKVDIADYKDIVSMIRNVETKIDNLAQVYALQRDLSKVEARVNELEKSEEERNRYNVRTLAMLIATFILGGGFLEAVQVATSLLQKGHP